MNVLVIGGGGREHALCWGLVKSSLLEKLFCAPGNAGIAAVAECITLDITNHAAVVDFCRIQNISLVVVGPEVPLCAGIVDDLKAADIAAFGPTKQAAALEGSKTFTKHLCDEANIPTADYEWFDTGESAKAYVAAADNYPAVIKADGLAAGKGVTIAEDAAAATAAIDACFDGTHTQGETEGCEVIIEEFLNGEEASLFVLADGKTAKVLGTAQDHKRAHDGDKGPNTGGMGAYSPAPVMTQTVIDEVMRTIIQPTLDEMVKRGTPYSGILYAGLMLTDKGPKLIEYNVRFGDPECQVIIPRLKTDLLELLLATAEGRLSEHEINLRDDTALTVVMAAKGYPGPVEKGTTIKNIDGANAISGVTVFHAGTKLGTDGALLANGGRVLNVTARAPTVSEAKTRAYQAVDLIDWPESHYRRDIAWRALEPVNQ
ncbi:MAG: phosphoribosylamine--glycine ligase [Pseudomonadota bacterium]